MIRCTPTDGSVPFEVPNDALLDRFTPRDEHIVLRAERIADIAHDHIWTPRAHGRPVECLIESWRERAERLERELAIAKSETRWEECVCVCDKASEGIGDHDYDEANAAFKIADDELQALRGSRRP